jgi:hypothetical protein
MAWALQFDGVNDYVSTSSDLSFTTTQEYAIEIKFKIDLSTSKDIHILFRGNNTNYLYYRVSTNAFLWKVAGSNVSISVPSASVLGVDSTIIVRQANTGSKTMEFVGLPEGGPFTALRTFLLSGFGNGGNGWPLDGYIQEASVYTDTSLITKVNKWDATASSHAAGTPILTDTIGGNNATGVNMPTDGSAWLDLGGGGLSLLISEQGPSFSESSQVSASQKIAAAVSVSGPSFTESLSATLSALPIEASMIEQGPSFAESYLLSVLASTNISAAITGQGPSFIESSTAFTSKNFSAEINEQGPSFTSQLLTSVFKDASGQIAEQGPSFSENSLIALPVKVTINTKNIVQVKRVSRNVTISRATKKIKVRSKTNTIRIK